METLLTSILEHLAQGGAVAVIAILFALVLGMLWYIIHLARQNTSNIHLVYAAKDKENASIKEIIDKYYQGNLNLVQALNEIKIVLITIQNTKR